MPELTIPTEFSMLKDQIAIITGGSSGIGLASTELFLSGGASVIIADINPPRTSLPDSAKWTHLKTDVTSWQSLSNTFKQVFNTYGKIDIVVVNAAVTDQLIDEDIFQDEFDPQTGDLLEPASRVLNINLTGALNTVKLATHYFSKNEPKGGKIVMTGSTCCFLDELLPAYQVSKYAVRGLMRSLRHTAPKFNVTINMVAPWSTDTGMMPPGARQYVEGAGFPVNEASSVARAIAYLAVGVDEQGISSNGKTIHVAGNRFQELEEAFDASRDNWIGAEWVQSHRNMAQTIIRASPSGW